MPAQAHAHPHLKRIAAALLLCAMLLRALIPPGLMPDIPRLASGSFHLVICTGYGPAEPAPPQAANLPTQAPLPTPHPAPATPHDSGLCPFAAFAFCAPVLLLLLALCAAITHLALVPPPSAAAPQSPARAPWSARAPPLFA